MRHRLGYFLSGFGIFVVGCAVRHASESDTSTSDATEITAKDEFLASQAFRVLPRKVSNQIRSAVEAASGPKAVHAAILLFASPSFRSLTQVSDDYSCTTSGEAAAIVIAKWAETAMAPKAGETADDADTRISGIFTDVLNRLTTATLTDLDGTLKRLACAESDAGASCAHPLFSTPSCSGDDDDTSTTTGAMLSPDAPSSDEGREVLASLFGEADLIRPSRAMQTEWTVLRDRYHAGISAAAKDTLRQARRGGSATLRRDGAAVRRFDEAGRMVDAFVRGGIALDVDAMNLVHSTVAMSSRGLRAAGDEAFQGRKKRRYLPGAAVESATNETFALVRQLRANKEATPVVAATFDQRMISIHPYADANGRTTRLMTDWILAQGGYPPALSTEAASASVLLWENARLLRDARLEHITEGMRRSVELVEAAS